MSFLGSLVKGIGGAVTGFLAGGPVGAVVGGVAGATSGGGGGAPSIPPMTLPQAGQPWPATPGIVPVSSTGPVVSTPPTRTYGININPPFGGAPGVGVNIGTGTSQFLLGIGQGLGQGAAQQAGQALQRSGGSQLPMIGAIGTAPVVRTEQVRKCPPGFVLAVDGNCYPKKMVPLKWRKWKPRKHGPIRYRDWKAVKRANAARNRIVKVAREAGLKGGKKSW